VIRSEYRDDGYWRQIWHVCSSILKRGSPRSFPQRGFVGQVSSLSVASDPRPFKINSIQLSRLPSTLDARLWRLTYGWAMCQPRLRPGNFGRSSDRSGKASVVDGAETSNHNEEPSGSPSVYPISTTSTPGAVH